jgi:TRAP transporter TAXI family solute receptor
MKNRIKAGTNSWLQRFLVGALTCLLIALLVSPALAQQKRRINIGGAQAGGVNYLMAVGWAEVINRSLPEYNAVGLETGGNVENPRLIGKGEIETGFCDIRGATLAYLGQPPFTTAIKNLRVGTFLQHAVLQIVTLEKSNIRRIEDLKGKVVNMGAAGSLVAPDMEALLRLHNIAIKDVKVRRLGASESMEALGDGLIDAAGVYGAPPAPAITSLAVRQKIRLISVDEKLLKSVQAKEYIVCYTIPPNTYKGQDEKVFAWAVTNGPFYSAGASADDVYKWTKVIIEHKDELAKLHPTARGIRFMTKEEVEVTPIPIHPGVLKYANEVGMKY